MISPILQSNPDFFQAHQIYALISNRSFDYLLSQFQMQNGVRLDSDISIFTVEGRIFDLYKIDNARHVDSEIVVQENGSWNGSQISSNYDRRPYKVPTRRRNLRNVTLDAVIYVRFDSIGIKPDLKSSFLPAQPQTVAAWNIVDPLPHRSTRHHARFFLVPPATPRHDEKDLQFLGAAPQDRYMDWNWSLWE